MFFPWERLINNDGNSVCTLLLPGLVQIIGISEKKVQVFPACSMSAAAPGCSLVAVLQEGESFFFFPNILWTVWELIPDNTSKVDVTVCTELNSAKKKQHCFESARN